MRIHVARKESKSVSGHDRRPRSALLLLAAAAAIAPIVAVPAANAADSGSNTSTVEITPALVRSITVSPGNSSFGRCIDTATLQSLTTLNVPGGSCRLGTPAAEDYVTVTNGPVPARVLVNGAEARPATGTGAGWVLGQSRDTDQFTEESYNRAASPGGVFVLPNPGCDVAFNNALDCQADANATSDEGLEVSAPTSSTATASTFTITTTWTAAP